MTEPLSSRVSDPAVSAVGSDTQFELMVEAHYARLGAFAYRLVGSRAAAEDVVHEVLLRIWRRRDTFSFDDPLPYLYQAVRHEGHSWRRAALRDERRTISSDEMPDRAAIGVDAANSVELDELARAIEARISALPLRRREIFRMQREQRLSYAAIASLLGISIKTVETQMGLALKALRLWLGPFLGLVVTLLR